MVRMYIDEVISGPHPNCTLVKVIRYTSPPFPWGYFEANLSVGDRVEVLGNYRYNSAIDECSVSLNGNADYHIAKYIPDPRYLLSPYRDCLRSSSCSLRSLSWEYGGEKNAKVLASSARLGFSS
jgi:hypothetical protein